MELFVKKIEAVDLLRSDGANAIASLANDTGKNLLPIAVYVKGNDVSGVTWGAEIGFSTSGHVPGTGDPYLNIFKLKQIRKELTDGGQTVQLFSPDDAGPDCQILDTDSFHLWCTRPAMAASYLVDIYVIAAIIP